MSTANDTGRRTVLRSVILGTLAITATARAQFPPLIDLGVGGANVLVTGAATGDRSGYSLTSGDVDGDGWKDLIVLSWGADPLGGARKGEVAVMWGALLPSAGNLDLSQVSAPTLSRIFGTTSNPYDSVLGGGDFNGDGYFDIIWGQPHGPNVWGDGIVYVMLGSSTFPDTLDIGADPSQVITMLGGPWGGGLGAESCGCDLDGDGYDDVVIAAPWDTWAEVFIVWGGPSFATFYDFAGTPAGVTRISESRPDQATGIHLACADIDNDAYSDLVIASPGTGPPPYSASVSILFGGQQFPDSVLFSDTNLRMKRIQQEDPLQSVGSALAVGDFNGDGQTDIAIGEADADPFGCGDCGVVHLLLTPQDLPETVTVLNMDAVRIIGPGNNFFFGARLELLDLTGDSRDELVVVSFADYESASSLDTTVVIYGTPAPPDTIFLAYDSTVTRILAPYHGVDLGKGITGADVNADGVDDLVLGADWFQGARGRSYVFFGEQVPSGAGRTPLAGPVLRPNFPNPFNPTTTIPYEIRGSGRVSLVIYDTRGRRVATLVDRYQRAGDHIVNWNGRDDRGLPVASGVYFCRLVANDRNITRKLVLLR